MLKEINSQKLKELEEKVNEFRGMSEIKLNIHALIRLLRVWRQEQQCSIDYSVIPLHLVFAGEPGTGKTQAAELMGEIYQAAGFLSEGGLIRKDAEVLKQTSAMELIRASAGNVLQLYNPGALTEKTLSDLLDALNENPENIAVILTGTAQELENVLETCPPLRLKFSKYFGFSNFWKNDFRQTSSRKLESFQEQPEAPQETGFPAPSMPVPRPLDRHAQTGVTLKPGARLDLTPYFREELRVRMVYEKLKLNMELDAYIFMLHDDELTHCDEDMIFFGNMISQNGGTAIVNGSAYPEGAFVLNRVYQDIQKIAVCFSAYGNHPDFDFSQIEKPALQIFYHDEQIARMDLSHMHSERTLVAVEFYRYQNSWRLRAVGAGYRDGLEELCQRYGVEVE